MQGGRQYRPLYWMHSPSERHPSELRSSDGGDRVPVEPQVLVDGLFRDALLVAVRAEAFQHVLVVAHGADTVALHAARAT